MLAARCALKLAAGKYIGARGTGGTFQGGDKSTKRFLCGELGLLPFFCFLLLSPPPFPVVGCGGGGGSGQLEALDCMTSKWSSPGVIFAGGGLEGLSTPEVNWKA